MEAPSKRTATSSEPARPLAEVRQRWRVTYRRRADAPPLAQREQAAAWETGLIASGLPLAGLDLPVPRPRLVFAAPLPTTMAGEAELLDVFLVQRLPVDDVRRRLSGALPAGHELVDAYDVWLGEAPLSGQVTAADYAVTIGRTSHDGEAAPDLRVGDVERAAEALLSAPAIPRTRDKGGRAVAYDLRPLLLSIEVASGEPPEIKGSAVPAGEITLRMRTRFDPERGVGRPDEVVAALGEVIGIELVARSTVRERLILATDR
jgi:radical SAM-linked protein